jgi:hypothetical protein
LIFSTKSSDFGITEHICSPIMRVSMVSNDVFLSPCLPSVLYIQYTAFPTSLIISSVEVRFQQRMPCDYNHYRFSCATTLPPRTTSYHLVQPIFCFWELLCIIVNWDVQVLWRGPDFPRVTRPRGF